MFHIKWLLSFPRVGWKVVFLVLKDEDTSTLTMIIMIQNRLLLEINTQVPNQPIHKLGIEERKFIWVFQR